MSSGLIQTHCKYPEDGIWPFILYGFICDNLLYLGMLPLIFPHAITSFLFIADVLPFIVKGLMVCV